MNWSYKFIENIRWRRKLNKTALKKIADDVEIDFDAPYYKDEFQFEIADVDRYATDKYFANLTLQETDKIYSIGFQLYNYQVGITGAVQYWHYEKNDFERAKRTFEKVKTVLKKTMTKIEYYRPPMAVITPMIRSAIQPIDVGRKERSGNYFYNWFEELAKEPDWRTTLYGNRYPLSTIQHIDSFWNTDDASKEIVSEGYARRRILRYKQASTQKEANLRQIVNKWVNFAKGFGIGVTIGWIGANATILDQKAAENPQLSPKQVFDMVFTENPETLQTPTSMPESADSQPEIVENPPEMLQMVDNGPETARMSQEVDTRDHLDGLDPMFAQKVQQILFSLAEKGWQPRVAEGLRSIEQQQEKIDQGYSSLKDPRHSKHVQGFAVDIIDSRYGWAGPASDLNFQFWNDLGEAVQKAGLVWGGNWESFKDVAHVEISDKTTGASIGVFRYAYRDIEWAELKYFVRDLAHNGYGEQQVGKALADKGVPSNIIRRLIAEVFVPYMASAYAENVWSHKFLCKTG